MLDYEDICLPLDRECAGLLCCCYFGVYCSALQFSCAEHAGCRLVFSNADINGNLNKQYSEKAPSV